MLFSALACGDAQVVAPEPLTIIDTSPGNGSLVPSGIRTIAVLFSADMDATSLTSGVTLDQITPGGSTIQSMPLSLTAYAKDTFTATYDTAPLPASSAFRLTVKMDVVRAASGAKLRADFVRSFRTAGP
jgi:hypothetical protein